MIVLVKSVKCIVLGFVRTEFVSFVSGPVEGNYSWPGSDLRLNAILGKNISD